VNEGIAYNRFHTRAMCSPNQASLLTGRNHHRVGAGQIAGLDNDWDGYSGHIPRRSALMADVLKDYGYATGDGANGTTPPRWRPPRPARSRTGPGVWALSFLGRGGPLKVTMKVRAPCRSAYHCCLPSPRIASFTRLFRKDAVQVQRCN
jgi:hypothetical protein